MLNGVLVSCTILVVIRALLTAATIHIICAGKMMFNGEMRHDQILKGLSFIYYLYNISSMIQGKIYLPTAKEPINYNAKYDDTSKFNDVQYLQKYIA